MPRRAREVFPNVPHHVTQRGGRRQQVFFNDDDRLYYLQCLQEYFPLYSVEVCAYCLMPNHVHLVVIPATKDGLHRLFKSVHSKYARAINGRFGWNGHLWQQRFFSAPLDDAHFFHAVRYVENNPKRANIVARPEDFKWSSARHHILKEPSEIITGVGGYAQKAAKVWDVKISIEEQVLKEETLRFLTQKNLPLGSEEFVAQLSQFASKDLRVRRVGRPKKEK